MRANRWLVLLLCGVSPAATPNEIRLWPNGAPGSEGKTAAEVVEAPNKDHGYLKVTSVHQPSLTVFLPPADKATGAGMIIAPGRRPRLPELRPGGDVRRRVSEQHRRGRLRAQIPPGARTGVDLQDRRARSGRRPARHPSAARPRRRVEPEPGAHRNHGILGRRRSGSARRHALRCGQTRRGRPNRPSEFAPRFRRADLSRHPRQHLHHPERHAA